MLINKPIPITIEPTVKDALEGRFECSGLLSFNENKIILEYQILHKKDKTIQMSATQRQEFPLKVLDSVEYKKKWFSAEIIIKAKSSQVLDGFFGADFNTLVLKVKGRDKQQTARNLALDLQLRLSDLELKALEGENPDYQRLME